MPHIQGAIYNLESTFRIIVSSNFLKTCKKSIVTLISKWKKTKQKQDNSLQSVKQMAKLGFIPE